MEQLIYEQSNRIGVIKINRPSALNALNSDVIRELDELLEKIKANQETSVLIIGSSENFAAGADIKNMMELTSEQAKEFSFSNTFDKLTTLEIPTIAAIEGFALGGGLELALACDLRIASKNAKLGFPEIKLGIMPGAGGTVRGPRLLGAARAKELIFLGEMIGADKAEQIGLVNMVVESGNVMDSALEWAVKLCAKSPVALKVAKKAIQGGLDEPNLEQAISLERDLWAGMFETDDQKEGMRAFIEKRKPVYQGK